MSLSEEKVEDKLATEPEKVEPTSPVQKSAPSVLKYNKYGSPINGVNKSDKAPFGHHPETGEVLAPFGFRVKTNIPRKRRAPPSSSTVNAHTAYLKKRENTLSNRVKDNLLKDLFGDRFAKPKEIKLGVKNDTSDIDSDSEEDMPRKSNNQIAPQPNYMPYLIGLALAAGGYYLLMKKKPPVKKNPPDPNIYQEQNNSPECIYSTEF